MTDDFENPASRVKIQDFEGQLLLITATEILRNIQTTYGPADCTVIDMTVLDEQTGSGYEHIGIRVFPRVLQEQLRPKVGTGRRTLGRLTQGTPKQGQDPPWMLADPTENDKAIARKFLANQSRRHQEAPF